MSLILAMVVNVGAVSGNADIEVALDLRPDDGQGGMEVVSNGVPLLVGQATDTKELHVLGPDGAEVPAQFRVLSRWWRHDNSIRWVLVTFNRTANEPAKPIYKLVGTKAVATKPITKMCVDEDDKHIHIDTGAAQFEVCKTAFNLLNKVVVNGQTIVHPDAMLGSVVTDPEGRSYYSSAGTKTARVLEKGPVMVKVLARGRHVSNDEGAFKPGLYGYEIFMTFHAGESHCDVDAILTNNSVEPIGEPHFDDWSLLTRLGKDKGEWQFDGLSEPKESLGGRANESVLLNQDSIGNEHWRLNLGVQTTGRSRSTILDLATFRGYKLSKLSPDARQEVAAGDFADGIVRCSRGQVGCTVSPRYFWQQFPSAFQFGGDGVVRLSPFPGEYKEVYWLEDASAKAQEFRLCFFAGDAREALLAAKHYQKCVFALPSPEHCGAAGALSDLGPYMMHEKIAEPARTHFSLAEIERKSLMPGGGYNNCFGWQVFGMNWIERAGVSGTNYEPLASSNSLWMHLLNRHPGRLEYGMRVARHARDVRTYHIEGQDNLAVWTTWKPGYWNNCVIEHWSRLIPGTFGHNPNRHSDWSKHPYARHRWPLPNLEHLNLDEVYDLYCITGDDRAFRSMRTIADHGMALSTLSPRPRRVYRKEGWCIRALARYYDLTGDQRYEPHLREAMDQMWADVDKAGPHGRGTWCQAIYARGAAAAWLASGDERMRDLAIGCADWSIEYEVASQGFPYHCLPEPWLAPPEKRGGEHGCRGWAAGYHLDLYGFAYAQTGDKKYLPAFEFAWEKNDTWWLGYFPTAMHAVYGTRPDKTPPATVTDLKATVDGSQATLTWTAPGDDGDEGTASVYQVKYAAKPILDFVPWPDKRHTHITFWGAMNVDDEPIPQPAGSKQNYTINGLKPGTYYFALKSRDECSNQNSISNVFAVDVK